jgi:hypothetical protein
MRARHLKIGTRLFTSGVALLAGAVLAVPLGVSPASAEPGDVINTPGAPPDPNFPEGFIPPELPVEVETELAPAGSLKQAPLWKELKQLLDSPYTTAVRRPGFLPAGCGDLPGAPVACNQALMPPLNVYGLDQSVLTAQTLRLRTSDGEISWDQPGLLFDPEEIGPGTPGDELLPVIGEIIVDAENRLVVCSGPEGGDEASGLPPVACDLDDMPSPHLPQDGTIIAVPAVNDMGELEELDPATQAREEVEELETPINEADLFRPSTDIAGVPAALVAYIGRLGTETLGKALFWDMQVGSDGVQACGSCHFAAGIDTRTKNQLNPNHLGGDFLLEVKPANGTLVASDFPFHKLANPDGPGDPLLDPGNIVSDSNDVMSSMGVRFRRFVDVPIPGTLTSFALPAMGVRPLRPDVGAPVPDPIPVFQGLRRVEPRNTPTIMASAFNFDNFWDGRARFHFNGGSVFGPADPQAHVFLDPGTPGAAGGAIHGATNGDFRPELAEACGLNPDEEGCEVVDEPLRIKFSSLASLSTGPALSDFEMSFSGRNWPKLGKKLLQGNGTVLLPNVTPLANQLVAPTDSRMGRFSYQGGAGNLCAAVPVAWRSNGGIATAAGKPGLCINYRGLIQLGFKRQLWHANGTSHLNGASAVCTSAENGVLVPPTCDPFDGYKLTIAGGAAGPLNRNQFTQMEANMSLFFGLGVQSYLQLLVPDNSPFDRFMDANPLAANAVGQPGEQGVLPPDQVAGLVGGGVTLVPGFGPDEIFGFDFFAGANLTAALPVGNPRNPAGHGSNPFLRSGRCMICHLGPEQTDHTFNVNHGLILSDTEFELPPTGAPEPTGPFKTVVGFLLEEEIAEVAQDAVEVENRNFQVTADRPDDPTTDGIDESLFDAQSAIPSAIAFQDNGVYNIGVRPSSEDIGRGGPDAFGWPLSLAAMAMKNLAGPTFEACDSPGDLCDDVMDNFDPYPDGPGGEIDYGGGLFEETGEDGTYPGCTTNDVDPRTCTLQDINPGFAMGPDAPELPEHLAPWANNLPAGELHPQIDELAFAPNTVTPPPFSEFTEIQFGSDLHCAEYNPDLYGPADRPPNFGWGPLCPNSQSAVPNSLQTWLNGTWPFPNRVARDGAFKAPQLRNVELTGPYFHTGSYLTLRQVVDFYFRGGDFPITNQEDRDPNLVDLDLQAFGLGGTTNPPLDPAFLDGIPDGVSQYNTFPDTAHATTPEPANTTEDVKDALVKFLISLTDNRVKLEQAPFDRPEIYVPINGRAPDNLLGRPQIVAQSTLNGADTCTVIGTGICFKRIPAVGAGGHPATPLPNFLGVLSTPDAPGVDHFDPKTTP